MLVALTVLALVVGALSTILIHATMSRLSSVNRFESLQTARAALDMIARDLRSAGYGVDAANGAGPQPAIAYVDSMQILMCEDQQPYPDASGAGAPQAYNPSGTPNPQPLVASQWTPPVKFGTGAEIIRYTLDLNDDGLVDAGDIASPQGADARRTPQPNDYTLVREVYGDYSGGIAGNNGGSQERIALVLRPGGAVAPLFNVYLNGSATPWDWSNGPVPAAQLAQITRVQVNVTASSPGPDGNGNYTVTPLVGAVLLTRNAPNFGNATYTVDGWVFEDDNLNRVRDGGEPGLAGAEVRLGSGRVAYTNASGYFAFRVPAAMYLVKHVPPQGYGSYSSPDSFTVNVAGAVSRSFADTLRTGGWVTVNVFQDTNGNGAWDAGEPALPAVNVTLSPVGTVAATNASGVATLFAATGTWSLAATPPANYAFTTPDPVTINMTAGGTATGAFGMRQSANGTITGRVFLDANADAAFDGTDTGISGVTVSVMDAAGATTLGTGVTDANGLYSITVPQNAGGSSYQVDCPSLGGYWATTGLAHVGLNVGAGQTLAGGDFGFARWTQTTLTTGAVVSMALADVWENDGSGAVPNTRKDLDLLLGYVDGTGGHAGLWNNNYPTATPYSGGPAVDLESWGTTAPTAIVCDSVTALTSPTAPYPVLGFPPTQSQGGDGEGGGSNVGIDKRTASATWPAIYPSHTTKGTQDRGTVSALMAYNIYNLSAIDLIVGTRYPTANTGGFELWHGSSQNGSLSWSAYERYPYSGSVPGQTMGEVNAMALMDINGDGKRDLVVATKTGATSGAILIFKFNGGTYNGGGDGGGWNNGSSAFTYEKTITFPTDIPTALAVGDVDGDGDNDIIVGTQASATTGRVVVLRNNYDVSAWSFLQMQAFPAPGAVTSIVAGHLNSSRGVDAAVGFCSNTATDLGGVRIYSNRTGQLDPNGVDPTSGSLTRWVIALSLGNLNYGTLPSTPAAPYLTDIAIGWKQSATAGGVTLLIR